MAGGIPQGPDATISGINVTPFVDVTLVLLVIFLVTAKLVVKPQSAIPLSLPRDASGEALPASVTVSLEKTGQLGVNGVRLSEQGFLLKMHELSTRSPGLKIILAADGDVRHRDVVRVMGLLRNAQIREIGFAVVPEAAPSPAAH